MLTDNAFPHILLPRHLVQSDIDAPTRQAYLETAYQVHEPGLTLEIGRYSERLDALHKSRGATCSTFITADNPLGEMAGETENQRRRDALVAELAKRKLAWVAGIGIHPNGQWPGEHSVLVLGLGRDGACDLGMRHAQNAVVWADEDAVPKLFLLR